MECYSTPLKGVLPFRKIFKDFSFLVQLIVVHADDANAVAVTRNSCLKLLCNSSIFLITIIIA